MSQGTDGRAPDGILVVDKPAGLTSHDVVARIRRLAGTRRVGHAGTLDPMATGVLVVGVGRATRLLGHLATSDKTYQATIRLGATTTTDDAEGEVLATASPDALAAAGDDAVRRAAEALVGEVDQLPPAVSAIKVDGRRSYARARAGEDVVLAPRRVTVHRLDVQAVRRSPGAVDVEATVSCSAGTYVRALARDLGALLGVGGHLAALRRTASGRYRLAAARSLDELERQLDLIPLGSAVSAAFPRRDVDVDEARRVGHGGRLPATGAGPGPVGVFGPDGSLLALVEERDGQARPLVVFVG